MIGLLCFILAVLASPNSRRAPTSVDCFAAESEGPGAPYEQRSLVLYSDVSMVSINPEGCHNHPARDARALAQGRLSLLLALEVALSGRAAADRDGPARADPADERRKSSLGRATHPRRTPQARV